MIHKEELFQATELILCDIVQILNFKSSGNFFLPEDIGEDLTYQFFRQDLIVEFEWLETLNYETNLVLGDYYNNEGTIKICLINSKIIDNNTISNIGEVLAHEMTHWLQEIDGFVFSDIKETDDNLYYLQQHEIEAQYYGFEFQRNHLNLEFDEVVNLWFVKYGPYHDFKNQKEYKDKLLGHLHQFSEKKLCF